MEWSNLKAHIEQVCPFQSLPCRHEGCTEKTIRKNVDVHAATCVFRLVRCQYCGISIAYNSLKNHITSSCELVPLKCIQGCSKQIPKKDMKSHIERDCPMTKVDCLFANSGCKEKIAREDMKSHIENNFYQHLLGLNEKTNNLSLQLSQKEEVIGTLQKEVSLLACNNHNFVSIFDANEKDHSLKFKVCLWDFGNLPEISKFKFDIPGFDVSCYFRCYLQDKYLSFYLYCNPLSKSYQMQWNCEVDGNVYHNEHKFDHDARSWGWHKFLAVQNKKYAFIVGSLKVLSVNF